MPDIRQTSILDDFSSYVGTVETGEFPTDPARHPWYTSPGSFPVAISSGGLGGTEFPPVSCLGAFTGASFRGNVETWGFMTGSPGETAGWRFGMYTVTSVAAGLVDGYQCLPHNDIGGSSLSLRKYTNGTFTGIGGVGGSGGGGQISLMRRNGDDIEIWQSTDFTGTTWTFRFAVSDPIGSGGYEGPFFFVYGTTGTETGWGTIGGGLRNRQHMYRWTLSRRGVPA